MGKSEVVIAIEQYKAILTLLGRRFPDLTVDKAADVAHEIYNAVIECEQS